MALDVEGRDRREPPGLIARDQVMRHPARLGRDRAALLQGGEEGVADEGVVGPGAGIPFIARQLGDAWQHLHRPGIAAVGHGS